MQGKLSAHKAKEEQQMAALLFYDVAAGPSGPGGRR